MNIAATEQYWRLPPSPIVEQQHKDFVCKFKSVLFYTRVAKPFFLPLQMFGNTKLETTNCQTLKKPTEHRRS